MNIETRRKRGLVAVNVIMSKLEQLTLGPYYFQTAVIFRNSLLLSTMLTNVESWFGLTVKEVETLEKVDEQLLRRIMSAHSKTAIPALYLELGCVPIRFIIMKRRIGFGRRAAIHGASGVPATLTRRIGSPSTVPGPSSRATASQSHEQGTSSGFGSTMRAASI